MNRLSRHGSLIGLIALLVLGLSSCKNTQPAPDIPLHGQPQHVIWTGDPIPLLADQSAPVYKVNIRGVVKNAVPVTKDKPIKLKGGEGELAFAAGVVAGYGDQPVMFRLMQGDTTLASLSVDPNSPQGWLETRGKLGAGAGELSITCDREGQGAYVAHPRLIPRPGGAKPRLIVFILVDAMRPDVLGAYGATEGASPNIDVIASKGAVFERAYTSSPFTMTSVASIFTGMFPWQHGVLFSKDAGLVLSRSVPTLVERLRDAGYLTTAFSGTYFFFSRNGFARGFDSMDESCESSFFKGSAECIASRVWPWLAQHPDEPMFVYVHFIDTHTPYDPPDAFRDKFTSGLKKPSDQEVVKGMIDEFGINRKWWQYFNRPSADELAFLKGLFRGEVAYADDGIGMIAPFIEDAWKRTGVQPIVLVTADHGESFYEHGVMEHVGELHEQVMRVPLIIKGPGVKKGERESGVARTIDMMPTILDLAGLEVPKWVSGRSLVPMMKGKQMENAPAAAVHYVKGKPEYTVVFWPWKLFARPDSGGYELYNLEKDPGEKNDLAEAEPERLKAMKDLFESLISLGRYSPGEPVPALDPNTEKKLESIGYISNH